MKPMTKTVKPPRNRDSLRRVAYKTRDRDFAGFLLPALICESAFASEANMRKIASHMHLVRPGVGRHDT